MVCTQKLEKSRRVKEIFIYTQIEKRYVLKLKLKRVQYMYANLRGLVAKSWQQLVFLTVAIWMGRAKIVITRKMGNNVRKALEALVVLFTNAI